MKHISNKILIGVVALLSLLTSCVAFSGSTTPSTNSFTLEFPPNADLGALFLYEDANCFTCGSGEKNLGRAIGKQDIRLPHAGWFVSLRMPNRASSLMPALMHPSLTNIGALDLEGSDIQDDDLKYVASINLRSIDLSRTQITGAGLRYLKPNQDWMTVDLEGCDKLDPQYLAHFQGWSRTTIRLLSFKESDDTYSQTETALLARARQILCNDEPEPVCPIQIR